VRRDTHIIIIIIIIIDRTIPNNTPDIIIRDNEKRTCILIDVTNSGDRNVIKKEAEKILIYKNLTIEIQRVWNVKARVIPVIIGATGAISKSFRKYVSDIPGNQNSCNSVSPRDMVCLGNMCMDTCIKETMMMNDDDDDDDDIINNNNNNNNNNNKWNVNTNVIPGIKH
jgi:hypothetical protein